MSGGEIRTQSLSGSGPGLQRALFCWSATLTEAHSCDDRYWIVDSPAVRRQKRNERIYSSIRLVHGPTPTDVTGRKRDYAYYKNETRSRYSVLMTLVAIPITTMLTRLDQTSRISRNGFPSSSRPRKTSITPSGLRSITLDEQHGIFAGSGLSKSSSRLTHSI